MLAKKRLKRILEHFLPKTDLDDYFSFKKEIRKDIDRTKNTRQLIIATSRQIDAEKVAIEMDKTLKSMDSLNRLLFYIDSIIIESKSNLNQLTDMIELELFEAKKTAEYNSDNVKFMKYSKNTIKNILINQKKEEIKEEIKEQKEIKYNLDLLNIEKENLKRTYDNAFNYYEAIKKMQNNVY